MNSRLQTRCLIGSIVAHVALCGLLIFAPGFKPETDAASTGGPALEIMSSAMVDALLASSPAAAAAAEPAATTTPPEPVVPPVAQPPPRLPDPEPPPQRPEPKAPARPVIEAPESDAREFVVAPKKSPEKDKAAEKKTPPKPTPKPRETPKFDFGQVKTVTDPKARKPSPAAEAPRNTPPQEDPSRARARALGGILANAAGSLTGTGSGRGAVNIQIAGGGGGTGVGGPGGGMGSANPLAIRNAYFAAWVTPPNVTDDLATVETEVTIQRDGTVVRSRVTRRSGISALDRSVEEALQRVKRITPFDPYPDPALQQQTFKIGFNLRARSQF